ncbi:cytochrome P450 [Gloeocapsopsis dulcis]|uniref:Cytochrome P450 n=1 Tax=Gloeocapsopsis dulcis AAB1 = 1H9 TaxID=1433147 RepID=A0A6N8FYV3_9CHRO|nr:cytochrome P450 [Gloeocapsopsis dulcis]MUL37904.1 cytochrome P450 [Gloeocapsopsis dulcis AAB1 = 1H9]WNN92290.1 cytochrome P450 [Gloeocapsopsis dulcis]
MKLPPGPKTPSWLIGLQFEGDPFGYMDNISQRYGDIVTLMVGSTPTIYVSNPLGIKEIFTNTKEIAARGELNLGFALMTGNQGVLQLDGLTHKNRRKLLMQTFHGARMQACGRRICELTEQIISKQILGKPFVAYPIIEDITLRVGIKVVMGLTEGKLSEKIKHLFTSILKQGQSPIDKILSNILGEKDLGRWSSYGYRLYLRQELFQLLLTEVEERRQQADFSRADMLNDLIFAKDETGQLLSNEEVRDLLLSPIYAAGDASGTAITWALYWIHRLPAVRLRLLSELDSLGDNPDPMSIFALPYLNAVCNEVLRIYPTQLFAFPRLVESTVEVMDYEFNPGTILIANIYSTHQREDLYPQPKEFQPERFLEKQFSSYEFLPFGGGSRVCIGATFALFEMKLILATILSRYELELVSQRPERPKFGGLICYPASGVKMVVRGLRQHQGQSQPLVVGSV